MVHFIQNLLSTSLSCKFFVFSIVLSQALTLIRQRRWGCHTKGVGVSPGLCQYVEYLRTVVWRNFPFIGFAAEQRRRSECNPRNCELWREGAEKHSIRRQRSDQQPAERDTERVGTSRSQNIYCQGIKRAARVYILYYVF